MKNRRTRTYLRALGVPLSNVIDEEKEMIATRIMLSRLRSSAEVDCSSCTFSRRRSDFHSARSAQDRQEREGQLQHRSRHNE